MSAELRLAAIVLAAGSSRRMGRRNKLLLSIEGKPLVRRVVESFLSGAFEKVVVVTGFEKEEVEEALAGLGVEFVFNPDFSAGMGTSIAKGVQSVKADRFDGFSVCVGDLAHLRPSAIEQLLEVFGKEGGLAAVAPVYGGARGHPVIFPMAAREALMRLGGDEGAKRLFDSGAIGLRLVEVSDGGVLEDIDSPDDLVN